MYVYMSVYMSVYMCVCVNVYECMAILFCSSRIFFN